jgi:hypothetical protein
LLRLISDDGGTVITVKIKSDGEVELVALNFLRAPHAVTTYASIANAPIEIQDQVATLKLLRVGEACERGARIDENEFWIYDKENKDGTK